MEPKLELDKALRNFAKGWENKKTELAVSRAIVRLARGPFGVLVLKIARLLALPLAPILVLDLSLLLPVVVLILRVMVCNILKQFHVLAPLVRVLGVLGLVLVQPGKLDRPPETVISMSYLPLVVGPHVPLKKPTLVLAVTTRQPLPLVHVILGPPL